MAKRKNENKTQFHKILDKKEKMNILKEADYYALSNIIEKISKGKKNYLLLGDFNSVSILDITRDLLKTMKKIDGSIANAPAENLEMISEHIKTIEMLSKTINELTKQENSWTHE